jgi:hypothetical protein
MAQMHEVSVSSPPAGVNVFDLARLEAAVAAVPDSQYAGQQRALTQLSHSLLFRCVQCGKLQICHTCGWFRLCWGVHVHSRSEQQQRLFHSSKLSRSLLFRLEVCVVAGCQRHLVV